MKKWISLLLVCLLLVGTVATMIVPVSAATPKESLIAAFKDAVPKAYVEMYLPMVENVLRQITVTQEQADGVMECINACKNTIKTDKGHTLHLYTVEERYFMLDQFKIACEILNLTYKISMSTDPDHVTDVVYTVYDAAGNPLADFDGDIVRKTNTAYEVDGSLALLAAVLLTGAVAAVAYGKKYVASR